MCLSLILLTIQHAAFILLKHPLSFGKGGRAIRLANILGDHFRYPMYGSMPTT